MRLSIIFSLSMLPIAGSLCAQQGDQEVPECIPCDRYFAATNDTHINHTEPGEREVPDINTMYLGQPALPVNVMVTTAGVFFEIEELTDDEDSFRPPIIVQHRSTAQHLEFFYHIRRNAYLNRARDVLLNGPLTNLRSYLRQGPSETLNPYLQDLIDVLHENNLDLANFLQNVNLDGVETAINQGVDNVLFSVHGNLDQGVSLQEYFGVLERLAEDIRLSLLNNLSVENTVDSLVKRLVWSAAFIFLYKDIEDYVSQYPALMRYSVTQMRDLAVFCDNRAPRMLYSLLRSVSSTSISVRVSDGRTILVDARWLEQVLRNSTSQLVPQNKTYEQSRAYR